MDEAAALVRAQGWPAGPARDWGLVLTLGQACVRALPSPDRARVARWLTLAEPPAAGGLWVDGSAFWDPAEVAPAQRALLARRVQPLAPAACAARQALQARLASAGAARGPAVFIAEAPAWLHDAGQAAILWPLCRQLMQAQVGFVFLVPPGPEEALARAGLGLPGGTPAVSAPGRPQALIPEPTGRRVVQ